MSSKKETQVIWKPHEGPQTEILMRSEKELLYGGARGGGKTAAGIIWMLQPVLAMNEAGNPRFPEYCGLVLRRNAEDHADWVSKADRIYRYFGGKKKGRPVHYEFPGGAAIYTNHFAHKDAFMKYQGQEFHRILLEEATQIPSEEWYELLLGSCRSPIEGLLPQILLTANPGGPGHLWVRDRFVNVADENGNRIPNGTPFYVSSSDSWRIFVPARVEDNPSLMQTDPAYVRFLESLPENLRKAWRWGDWDSFAGQFFGEFRPYGPVSSDEPPMANHVISAHSPEAKLDDWWHRWGSIDWGYSHPSAVLWACENPQTAQVHIYRELREKKLGSKQLGAKIAERSAADLAGLPEPVLVFYLDPTTYQKRDDGKLIPEQIAEGIDEVLGLGVARLVMRDDETIQDSTGKVLGAEDLRVRSNSKPAIVIRPASNARIAGWQLVREFLRWWPLIEGGELDESLPKVLIHDCCQNLIDGISILIHDEDDPEDVLKMDGDDFGDALRYLLMAASGYHPKEPMEEFIRRRLKDLQAKYGHNVDPTVSYMVARKAEADWRKQIGPNEQPVRIIRNGSLRVERSRKSYRQLLNRRRQFSRF